MAVTATPSSVKVGIVTGANTGIGYETALALCQQGYTIVLACRSQARGTEAAERINLALLGSACGGTAEAMVLDLTDLASVKRFADAFLARFTALHSLILNAGMNISQEHTPDKRRTVDGFELCMQRRSTESRQHHTPCRIVALGSVAHRYTYNHSKIACIMFAYELQRRFDNEGITEVKALAVNPGAVMSDIWRHLPGCLRSCLRPAMSVAFLTVTQGAAPSIAAATKESIDGVPIRGGEYLVPYHILSTFEPFALACEAIGPFAGAKIAKSTALTYEVALRAALWDASEAAVAPFMS